MMIAEAMGGATVLTYQIFAGQSATVDFFHALRTVSVNRANATLPVFVETKSSARHLAQQ